MTPMEQLAHEVLDEATPKLQAADVGGILFLVRRYPDGYLDVSVVGTGITLSKDEAERVFKTAIDRAINQPEGPKA